MQTIRHPLRSPSLGTQREIVSFHYGQLGGSKIYIQSSLHADELPGMLVAYHLRQRLAALENAGAIRGEIVVVPVANPIGLAQTVLHTPLGRFEASSGENFNRYYPALFQPALPLLEGKLGANADLNKGIVRQVLRQVVAEAPATTEIANLRKLLLSLACDADVVLDLHCDSEAVVHLYTGTPLWPQAEPLARYMGAEATLLAVESGDNPFDEACSQHWWLLAEHFAERHPIPLGCLSVTVELRSMTDVNHALAAQDAERLIAFLQYRDVIAGEPPPLPPLKQPATPLAGSETLVTPVSGLVVFLRQPGEWINKGEPVVEIIDPLADSPQQTTVLKSTVEGLLYARENRRFATAGMALAKIAGSQPFRHGKLLGV